MSAVLMIDPQRARRLKDLLVDAGVIDEGTELLMPLPEVGMIRVADVLRYVMVSRATWLQWVKDGIAPQPIKVGSCTFWSARDIREFIKSMEEGRDAVAA